MTIRTRFLTWLHGRQVGSDHFGNRYFVEKNGGPKRWVLYNGIPEASKVPPEWNAWLHHTIDELPPERPAMRNWEQDHVPNLTGTPGAYRPPGHVSQGGRRSAATGDYEPWRPE